MVSSLANTFLFAEPLQHYLEYSTKVLRDLIAANRQSGQTIVELVGSDANAAKVKEQLASLNPMVFSMAGHGNYTTTTLECTEMFMQVGLSNGNIELMKDRVVHTNSCECGRDLGPAIMKAGALGYVGSNESFWFYTGDAANATRAVRSPFLAEWQFEVSLLQGRTVGEAREDMRKKYEEELTYWIEGEGKNHPDASEIARIININKSISTFSGDVQTKPSTAGGATQLTSSFVAPAVIIVAVAGLAWLVFRKRRRKA